MTAIVFTAVQLFRSCFSNTVVILLISVISLRLLLQQ